MGKKILIVEPRNLVRKGLHAIFEEDDRVSNVYEATTLEELKKQLLACLPDLLVIHQSLVTDIKQLPRDKFVLLIDEVDINMLLAAYKHQARGCLSEPFHPISYEQH